MKKTMKYQLAYQQAYRILQKPYTVIGIPTKPVHLGQTKHLRKLFEHTPLAPLFQGIHHRMFN